MFMSILILSREKKLIVKLTSSSSVSVRGVVACVPACDVGESCAMFRGDMNFFF